MRVTDGMRFNDVRRNLSRLNAEHARVLGQAQTGRRLAKPSEDPIAAAALVRVQASAGSVQAHQRVIGQVRGDAALAESTLNEANQLLQQFREIAVQAGNDSYTATDRLAFAEKVSSMKEQLVNLGNTRGSRGQLFGGTSTDSPAFDATGTFLGNDRVQVVEVTPGQSAVVNASGARAFTAVGGRDVFADIDALETALRNNDSAAVRATLPDLEESNQQVVREQVRTGIILERLDSSESVLDTLDLQFRDHESRLGDADPFETFSRLSELDQALEKAVTASRSLLSLGLDL